MALHITKNGCYYHVVSKYVAENEKWLVCTTNYLSEFRFPERVFLFQSSRRINSDMWATMNVLNNFIKNNRGFNLRLNPV